MKLHRFALGLFLCSTLLTAQPQATPENNPNTWNSADSMRIIQQVRKQLLSLPRYSVFDSLRFGVQGRTIILEGYASRPILKDDAEGAVKNIPGVEAVKNEIEVLPNSPNDDRIRVGVYRRIYTAPTLRKYTGSPVGFGRFVSPADFTGITNNPPLGYHAIHIIVKNGNVILTGAVDNESDATIAYMQANSTPGTFKVDNDLIVPNRGKK